MRKVTSVDSIGLMRLREQSPFPLTMLTGLQRVQFVPLLSVHLRRSNPCGEVVLK